MIQDVTLILNLIAIIVCGGAGALLAWAFVTTLGWTGVGGTIAAAMLAMAAATLLWAAGVALLRALRLLE